MPIVVQVSDVAHWPLVTNITLLSVLCLGDGFTMTAKPFTLSSNGGLLISLVISRNNLLHSPGTITIQQFYNSNFNSIVMT